MIILNVKQNTPEWLEMRRNKIGASDCPIIMDSSPYKGPRKLYREKVFGENTYFSAAMRAGSEMEGGLRENYNDIHGTKYEPLMGQHETYEWMIASLDGYDPVCEEILEIKTCSESVYNKYSMDFPDHWVWQAHHQMMVADKNQVTFFVANRDDESLTFCHIVKRDEDKIDQLINREKEFYACMINYEEPGLGRKEVDFVARDDSEWKNLSDERREIDEQIKKWTRLKEENKLKFIDLAKGEPSKGFGVTLSVAEGRKTVDYSRIPEITQLDLSPYTRYSAPTWKLTISRKSS